MKTGFFATVTAVFVVSQTTASETVTPEPDESSYHFVSQYGVEIGAPVSTVWNQLIDLSSWMYEFDLVLESGTPGKEGEVRRLYLGQEFFIEIIKLIPNELMVFSIYPSPSFQRRQW